MVRSRWVYRKLRNFRAGIEADISCLKRAYGLARCTWRGLGHFRAYVWSAAVAYNLALFPASSRPEADQPPPPSFTGERWSTAPLAPAARSAALAVGAHRISHARRAKPPLPRRPDSLTN
jgi:hypothetical protein